MWKNEYCDWEKQLMWHYCHNAWWHSPVHGNFLFEQSGLSVQPHSCTHASDKSVHSSIHMLSSQKHQVLVHSACFAHFYIPQMLLWHVAQLVKLPIKNCKSVIIAQASQLPELEDRSRLLWKQFFVTSHWHALLNPCSRLVVQNTAAGNYSSIRSKVWTILIVLTRVV